MSDEQQPPADHKQSAADVTTGRRAIVVDEDEGGGKVKVAQWVVVLVVTNLLAIFGPATTFIAWKATIETEQRRDREQGERAITALRSSITEGLQAVERRLDRSEPLQTEVATLRAELASLKDRLSDQGATIRAMQDSDRRRR